MHYDSAVCWIFICMFLTVFARRELYNTKCKRDCNTEEGSSDCWKATTDGFAYGLSTAMIDFCQVILKLRQLPNETESWYDISRKILAKKVEEYELDDEVRQLSKEAVEQIAMSLLDKCFYAESTITSFEPTCLSCTESESKLMHQWRLSSIILFSIGLLFVFIILLLYTLYSYHIRHSYVSI